MATICGCFKPTNPTAGGASAPIREPKKSNRNKAGRENDLLEMNKRGATGHDEEQMLETDPWGRSSVGQEYKSPH